MRLAVAALAAAITVAGGGSARVSTQGVASDGVFALLSRLEGVVLHGDVAAYQTLLADSADRESVARFVEVELAAGMTRAVIQERDRGPLAGTLDGDGYSVAVDVFQEFGARARISTWLLEVRRTRDEGTDTPWRIADLRSGSARSRTSTDCR